MERTSAAEESLDNGNTMLSISGMLDTLHLHDSTLLAMRTAWNGVVDLDIDIDEVWNKGLDPDICGIRFSSVFEIANFKIDRLNILGSVELKELEGYDTRFVVNASPITARIIRVDFEFVAGGRLSLVCADEVEYLRKSPSQELERMRTPNRSVRPL